VNSLSVEAGKLVVMLRFPNALGVIFGTGMTEIAWRAPVVRSARCADSRILSGHRSIPTVVLTRIDFERFTNNVISSAALQRNAKPRKRHDFRHPNDGLYAAKHEARPSNIQLLQLIAAAAWLAKWWRLASNVTARIGRSSWILRFALNDKNVSTL
jgi:hypothetical protein